VLNIMWMISGSGNSHFHTLNEADLTGTAATYQERTTYGCIRQVTLIGPEVFIILLVMIIFFLVMLGIDLTAFVYNHFDKNKKKANRLPFDLLDWQAGLVGKMTGNNAIKAKELWEYEFYMDESLEHYRCRKIDKNVSVCIALSEDRLLTLLSRVKHWSQFGVHIKVAPILGRRQISRSAW
jgi:hypothetical protein